MKIISVMDEPLTLAETKLHLRITVDDVLSEDTLILSLITAAREYCENVTGRALATQELEHYLDRFPSSNEIEIPYPPLQSIENVSYTDSNGNETIMAEGTDYLVDTDSTVGRVVLPYGKSWATATLNTVNPIKIRYTAGYTVIPKTIKQAMLLLIGHWYENREATAESRYVKGEIDFAVKALLSQYRVRWF